MKHTVSPGRAAGTLVPDAWVVQCGDTLRTAGSVAAPSLGLGLNGVAGAGCVAGVRGVVEVTAVADGVAGVLASAGWSVWVAVSA